MKLDNPDLIRAKLKQALVYSFMRAGYGIDESTRLADIAIESVNQALELAYNAMNMYIDYMNVNLPTTVYIKDFNEHT